METRRLLSMLELLGPFLGPTRLEKARPALKRHLDTFDDLRDTHVQLLAVAPWKDRSPLWTQFAEYLQKREKRFVRRTRKNIKRIKTRRLGKLLMAWHEEIQHTYADSAPRNTNAKLRDGLRAPFDRTAQFRATIDPANTTTTHRTRVAFKKFRYMMEIVTTLIPGSHQRLLAAPVSKETANRDSQQLSNFVELLRIFPQQHQKLVHGAAAQRLHATSDALFNSFPHFPVTLPGKTKEKQNLSEGRIIHGARSAVSPH